MIAVKVERKTWGDCRVEGAKRQYAPYVTTWTCPDPACSAENELDHTSRYFMFPIFGEPNTFSLCCLKCDEAGRPSDKGEVKLTLDVVVTVSTS